MPIALPAKNIKTFSWLLLLLTIGSCQSKKKFAGSLAFEFIPKNKNEIFDEGFKPFLIHTEDKPRPYKGLYERVINDTVISLYFEEDKLLSKHVHFKRKKFDSLALFRNLEKQLIIRESKGEVLTMEGHAYGEHFTLKDRKSGQVYEVWIYPSHIRLSQAYAQPSKADLPEPPAATDTVKITSS